jgi:hypothetical protein
MSEGPEKAAHKMGALGKYSYAWLTLAFFLVSLLLHWWFGWKSFVEDAREHGQVAEVSPYLSEMLRDTFENWQSEFLQLLWQVVGLAYFLYIGSPSSKENDDRLEAKVDELLRIQAGEAKGQRLIDEIDEHYLRDGGHAGRFDHHRETSPEPS